VREVVVVGGVCGRQRVLRSLEGGKLVLSLHHFQFLQLENVFNHRFYFEIVLRIG